jgi:nucleoside-diphosphate-sugar epimerase
MSRVAITGGSGFIGSNLVEYLSNAGHEVLSLDLRPPRNPAAQCAFKPLDVLDRNGFIDAIATFDPHYFIHLASRTDLAGKSEHEYRANIEGVSNAVAAALSGSSLKRALFASSMYVCNMGYIPQSDEDYCPHTAYGKSKVIGEQIVRRELGDRRNWAFIRPTSIWGPWFGEPYITFFHVVRNGMYLHPRGHRIRRSYGFVLNTVHQIARLMEHDDEAKIQGRVFYVADYEPIDTRAWAQTIASNFGSTRIHDVPLAVLRLAAKVGDIQKRLGVKNPKLTTFRLNNLLTNAVFDLSPLREIAGPQPYTISEGVTITVKWMRKFALGKEPESRDGKPEASREVKGSE